MPKNKNIQSNYSFDISKGLIVFSIFYFYVAVVGAKELCKENHAAYDFGSGTTKLVIAEVDTCEKRIIRILTEKRLAIALNENLEMSPQNQISKEILNGALPELKKWSYELVLHKVKKKFAIATAVYRKANNGRDIIKYLENNLHISIRLISQDEEAQLGYWAVRSQGLSDKKNLIVWDIGGGSMQFYRLNPEGKGLSFKGDLASVSFKNKILKDLYFIKQGERSSPNPLGPWKAERAIRIAQNHALLNVPEDFKNKKYATWVGIGGVLSQSVQKQADPGKDHFSEGQLYFTLKHRAVLPDTELAGDYRATDISNLALVLGYMRALQIQEVLTRSVSLGQGLIFRNLFP